MGSVFESACRALVQSGWLPSGRQVHRPGDAGDWLPLLLDAWTAAGGLSGGGRRAEQLVGWLRWNLSQGARLVGEFDGPAAQRWLGCRFIWWPRGAPPGRHVGLASSRLGRRLDRHQSWFKVFRAACAKVDGEREVVVTAATTTTHDFVQRAADLFGIRIVTLLTSDDTQSLESWLEGILNAPASGRGPVFPAFLSPPIPGTAPELPDDLHTAPLSDRAVCALSDRLLVFHVRRGGHLERLVRARLADRQGGAASVFLALGPQLVAADLADELLALGAVGWVVMDAGQEDAADAAAAAAEEPPPPDAAPRAARVVPLPAAERWSYLTHCTRARFGAWPDQASDEYLDELILDGPDQDRSALAALRRIIEQQRIIASSQALRGAAAMVAFTAVPLAELPGLRAFRPHRGRWDFEPYGICIQRDWLIECGARPVLYGDDHDWERLDESDRPFFQRRTSRAGKSGAVIDWSREREWRQPGHVDLRDLPAEAGLVFVPSEAEAQALADVSRWPITVLATE